MKKCTISREVIPLCAVFWLFYPPGYLSIALGLSFTLNTLKYIASLWLLTLALITIVTRKTTPSKLAVLIVLFFLQLLLATLLSDKGCFACIRHILPPIAVIMYYDQCHARRKLQLVRSLFWIHFIIMVLNLISVLVCPDGLYEVEGVTTENYYFIGHNNAAARFLLPGSFYAIILDSIDRGKLGWKTYCMVGLSFLTVTLTWSNTAMVGLGIVLILLLIIPITDLPKAFTAKNSFILSIILFTLVVMLDNTEVLRIVVEKVFQKDLTLTGRVYIWDNALRAIVKRPLFGYGYEASSEHLITTGRYTASGAHNFYLDTLLRGGALQLSILMAIIVEVCRAVDDTHKRLRQLETIVLLSYFVMWQFEPFINSGYIDMMLVFMMMIDLHQYNSIYRGESLTQR